MVFHRQIIGRWGEHQAKMFFEARGLRILALNYRTPLGELDLVAEDGRTVVFVEVKTRLTNRFGAGEASVNLTKQRRLVKAALIFLKRHHWTHRPARFDVFLTGSQGQAWIPSAFPSMDHYTV